MSDGNESSPPPPPAAAPASSTPPPSAPTPPAPAPPPRAAPTPAPPAPAPTPAPAAPAPTPAPAAPSTPAPPATAPTPPHAPAPTPTPAPAARAPTPAPTAPAPTRAPAAPAPTPAPTAPAPTPAPAAPAPAPAPTAPAPAPAPTAPAPTPAPAPAAPAPSSSATQPAVSGGEQTVVKEETAADETEKKPAGPKKKRSAFAGQPKEIIPGRRRGLPPRRKHAEAVPYPSSKSTVCSLTRGIRGEFKPNKNTFLYWPTDLGMFHTSLKSSVVNSLTTSLTSLVSGSGQIDMVSPMWSLMAIADRDGGCCGFDGRFINSVDKLTQSRINMSEAKHDFDANQTMDYSAILNSYGNFGVAEESADLSPLPELPSPPARVGVEWALTSFSGPSSPVNNIFPRSYLLEDLYLCDQCRCVLSKLNVTVELDSYYCPSCLDNLPTTEAHMYRNQCVKCFNCPRCQSTLSIAAFSTSDSKLLQRGPSSLNANIISAQLDPSSPSGGDPVSSLMGDGGATFYFVCQYCRWDSQHIELTSPKPDQLIARSINKDVPSHLASRLTAFLVQRLQKRSEGKKGIGGFGAMRAIVEDEFLGQLEERLKKEGLVREQIADSDSDDEEGGIASKGAASLLKERKDKRAEQKKVSMKKQSEPPTPITTIGLLGEGTAGKVKIDYNVAERNLEAKNQLLSKFDPWDQHWYYRANLPQPEKTPASLFNQPVAAEQLFPPLGPPVILFSDFFRSPHSPPQQVHSLHANYEKPEGTEDPKPLNPHASPLYPEIASDHAKNIAKFINLNEKPTIQPPAPAPFTFTPSYAASLYKRDQALVDMASQDLSQLASLDQKLRMHHSNPAYINECFPTRKTLLTKRSYRCQTCMRFVVKAQINPNTTPPYRLNNAAIFFLPRMVILRFSPSTSRAQRYVATAEQLAFSTLPIVHPEEKPSKPSLETGLNLTQFGDKNDPIQLVELNEGLAFSPGDVGYLEVMLINPLQSRAEVTIESFKAFKKAEKEKADEKKEQDGKKEKTAKNVTPRDRDTPSVKDEEGGAAAFLDKPEFHTIELLTPKFSVGIAPYNELLDEMGETSEEPQPEKDDPEIVVKRHNNTVILRLKVKAKESGARLPAKCLITMRLVFSDRQEKLYSVLFHPILLLGRIGTHFG
eukprot:GHVN01023249.1.p1 GENE.GHVN01023249.1~~GHVN01023249.1.p1  ORF type:complete len:1146 (-),score=228.14 GHVN01023249.1:191-3628(-)